MTSRQLAEFKCWSGGDICRPYKSGPQDVILRLETSNIIWFTAGKTTSLLGKVADVVRPFLQN